jgi:6,7-dimethyl-8-ribityllumazine synthase
MTQPHVLIVASPYYRDIYAQLVAGAKAALEKAGATFDVEEVPGAFEIPAAVAMGIASEKYHAYVALGCVIRGETSHYDYVCGESARGLQTLALEELAPIGYGILTCETLEQAMVRADITQGNKGGEAASVALHMFALQQKLLAA